MYFLTFTVVDWIDIFTKRSYRDIVMNSFEFCIHNKGLNVYGYVIMSNHLHCILKASGNIPLYDIVRDFKKFTSRNIIDTIIAEPESRREWLLHKFQWNAAIRRRNSIHQLWSHHNHAEEIFTYDFFNQKLNYIHLNPVRAGYVDFPEDYIYSSAYELSGRGGKIGIDRW